MKIPYLLKVICLCAVVLFVGCSNKENKSKEGDKGQQSDQKDSKDQKEDGQSDSTKKDKTELETQSQKVSSDFEEMINKEKKPAEVFEFLKTRIKDTTVEDATKMVEKFIEYQKKAKLKYSAQLAKDNVIKKIKKYNFTEIKVDKIEDETVKKMLEEIEKGGFKLTIVQGIIVPSIDYEKLKPLTQYVKDELKDYVNIEAQESTKPVALDKAMLVTWDELAERINNLEKYLKKYKEKSTQKDEIKKMYEGYMKIYMGGLANTTVYDKNKKFKKEVLDSYNTTVARYKDTDFAKTIKEYIGILQKEKYEYTKYVDLFVKDFKPKEEEQKSGGQQGGSQESGQSQDQKQGQKDDEQQGEQGQ